MSAFRLSSSRWLGAQLLLLGTIFAIGWRDWEAADNEWISISGGFLMLAALIVALSGFHALGRNLSPGPNPSREHSLVMSGIYRHIRHPLYASLILLSVGWSVFTQSWMACGATLGLLAFLRLKAHVEEQQLKSIYPHYRDYVRRTGCFLPRVGN